MGDKVKEVEADELQAKVTKLAELIGYQRRAVVSRTIIDEETGTVTLFAFDESQGLSEHTAPFDAMVYLLDGDAEVSVASKSLKLKAGEMTIMPANKPHSLKAITRFKMLLIMVKKS